jgi:putative flippase GtrA
MKASSTTKESSTEITKQIFEFAKYFAASGAALLLDYGVYWLLANSGWLSLPNAAVIGYLAGLILAYFLIGGRIFKNGWLRDRKIFEMMLFGLSGLLGVVITYITVKTYVSLVGQEVNQAKLVAIGFSFISVYLFRKFFVFKPKNI